MINKLTGMPVSPQMLDVLARLQRDEMVPYEEISKLPEIQEAYSCINNSVETHKLRNRENLQNTVVQKLSSLGSAIIDKRGNVTYNGIVGQNNRLDIVIGLPASGKSSALVNPLSQEFKSRIIDSDMAKELLPEFNGGWGAGVVHQESKKIINTLLRNNRYQGINLVYPIVGSDIGKVKNIIRDFQDFKYDIYLHYSELSPAKTLGRMISRFLETGRFLDPKLIVNYGSLPKATYEQLKGEHIYEWQKQNSTGTVHDNLRDGNAFRGHGYFSDELGKRKPGEINENVNIGTIEMAKPGFERSRFHGLTSISGFSHWDNDVPYGQMPRLLETDCQGKFFERGICNHYTAELQYNGFQVNRDILNSCLRLHRSTHNLYFLKEICHLYKNPNQELPDAANDAVRQIGDACKEQELYRCPSFRCQDMDCPEV